MLRSSIDARIPDGLPRGIALEAPVGKPMASSATAATTVMNVIKRLRMALLLFCGSTSHSIARVASADASKKGHGASLCSRVEKHWIGDATTRSRSWEQTVSYDTLCW